MAYFGIYGEFEAPSWLSQDLGMKWRFSGYTNHSYILTPIAQQKLGNKITEQEYTKSNLVDAPEEDRWMVPKPMSMEEFVEEHAYYDDDPSPAAKEEYEREVQSARNRYPSYVDNLNSHSPLVVHNSTDSGTFAYIGFVNGDGNIPKIVRALLTKSLAY